MTLSITYADKWLIEGHPDYAITTNGIVYNIKRGKPIKKCYKTRSIGYWLNGKFYTISSLMPLLKKIPTKQKIPF